MAKHAARAQQLSEPAAPRLTRRELRMARQLPIEPPASPTTLATTQESEQPLQTTPTDFTTPSASDPLPPAVFAPEVLTTEVTVEERTTVEASLLTLTGDLALPPVTHSNQNVAETVHATLPVSPTPPAATATPPKEIHPTVEGADETASTLLFSTLSPLTPLHSTDAKPQQPASGITETTETKRPTTRPLRHTLSVVSGLIGATALCLTFALPGIQTLNAGEDEQLTSLQQSMYTGNSAQEAESFDALNVVNAEPGQNLGSFINIRDSAVQYPFADTVALTDPFGERAFPVAGFHDAQDFAAPAGTPVQVIADGVVTEAGMTTDGCGFGLKVEHQISDSVVTSRYCHMQMNSHGLQIGDPVQVGDHAGLVGNTGLSFGPHLHFVITINGEAVDPMPFLLQHNRETRPTAQ